MSRNFPQLLAGNQSILDAEEVASYKNYHDAQKAIDKLEQAGFTISNLAIIGKDVRTVEQILGRISVGKEFLGGFAMGTTWGLFAVLLLLIGMPAREGGLLFFIMMVLGLGLFAGLMRALMFALSSKRHGFASARMTLAHEYTIVALQDAQQARAILGMVRPQTQFAAQQSNGPTPFGSRPDEQPRFGVRLNQQQAPGQVLGAPQQGTPQPQQWGQSANMQAPLQPGPQQPQWGQQVSQPQDSGAPAPQAAPATPAFGVRLADYLPEQAAPQAAPATDSAATTAAEVAPAAPTEESDTATQEAESPTAPEAPTAAVPAETDEPVEADAPAAATTADTAEAEEPAEAPAPAADEAPAPTPAVATENESSTENPATFPSRRSERRQHHDVTN